MARYLLDSVIVIDHFNGVDEATEFLATHGRDCVISVITRAETLVPHHVSTSACSLSYCQNPFAFIYTKLQGAVAENHPFRNAACSFPGYGIPGQSRDKPAPTNVQLVKL